MTKVPKSKRKVSGSLQRISCKGYLLFISGCFILISCSSANVIRSDDRVAVIEISSSGEHSEADGAEAVAEKKAEQKAEELLGTKVNRLISEDKCVRRTNSVNPKLRDTTCTYVYEKITSKKLDSLLVLAASQDQGQWSETNQRISEKILGGESISKTDEEGWPPLSLATRAGNIELVKILLKSGAKVDYASDSRSVPTALEIAVSTTNGGYPEMVQLLLAAGAEPQRVRSEAGTNALGLAAENCQAENVKLLILSKSKSNPKQQKNSITAALAAAFKNKCQAGVLRPLLKANGGARQSIMRIPLNYYGRSAEFTAEVIDAFLEAGAKLNEQDADGHTILWEAYVHMRDLIEPLQARGAKFSPVDIADIEESKNRPSSPPVLINSQFCAKWAMKMPSAATPVNRGDYDRACSNAWPRGSIDHQKCVQTWRDCEKFY